MSAIGTKRTSLIAPPAQKTDKSERGVVMMKFAIAALLAVVLASPAFAANEKQADNPAKGKGWHCRKLAYEKYHIQDGRALNKAVGAAIERCKQHGPSAL